MAVTTDFDAAPIGMFDSGVGGLTVARALIDVLPGENILYVGDTLRGPFGPRDLDDVDSIAFEICDWLVRAGSKLIVVACNTAASAALEALQAAYDVPIIGVIEPGVRAALRATRRNRIGVAATVGTVQAGAYDRVVARLGRDVELVSVACPGLVEFVERGDTSGPEVLAHTERLLAPLRSAHIDTLILGCTHYPLLARVISDAVGRDVTLISSADETAFEALDICTRTGMTRNPSSAGASATNARHVWTATADASGFRRLGRRFLGPEVDSVHEIDLRTPF